MHTINEAKGQENKAKIAGQCMHVFGRFETIG